MIIDGKEGALRTRLVGLISFLLIIFSIVVIAPDVSHTGDEILPSTFRSGNFTFNDSLTILDSLVVNATTLVVNSATQRVGIGTTSPQNLLHVGAGVDAPFIGSTAIITAAGTTNLAIRDSTNDVELLNYAYSGGGIIGTSTNHNLTLRTNNANAMTILTTGSVGIGTTSPVGRFTVDAGAVSALNSVISGSRAGATGLKLTNTDETGSAILAFGNTTSLTLTPAYIVKYGPSHATRPNDVEIYTTGTDGDIIFNAANFVGMGDGTDATDPDYPLDIDTAGNGPNAALNLADADTGCSFNTNDGTPSCVSDERTKKDIETMDTTQALNDILALRPVTFRMKNDPDNEPLKYGFTAQDVQKVLPQLVSETEHNAYDFKPLTVDKQSLITWVVGAVKELNKKVEKLEKPTGITIYDTATGKQYCITVTNGVMKNIAGECKA